MKTIFHILLLLLTLTLLANGQLIVAASSKALIIWFEALIPSMFVSMVLIKTCLSLHCFEIVVRPFQKIIHQLFRLDLASFTLVLASVLIGFPAFSISIDELVEKRKLSSREGQRLVYCCSCASASFILMSLGIACFQSLKVGFILYLIQVISVLILLFVTRKVEITCDTLIDEQSFFQAFSTAIFSSVKALVIIVSYLMIALSLLSLGSLFLPSNIQEYLSILTEFSSGSIQLATSNLPLHTRVLMISGLLSFGGLCVHLQVHGSCTHLKLDVLTYLNYRLFQVLLAILLTMAFLKLLI